MVETSVDPIPESPGARRPAEESTATTGRLGGGKQLAPMADGSKMMPGATAEIVGSSAANAGEVGATPVAGVEKPVC